MRRSWYKRFLKDSRGVSLAIGTILLVLAFFLIASNIFMFTISQGSTMSESLDERSQTFLNRVDEEIVASDGNYSVVGDEVRVETRLTNVGTVSTSLITLWVCDLTQRKYGFNDTIESLDLNLNPGDVIDCTGENALTVTISGAGALDDFSAWFITLRGNKVPVTESDVMILSEVSHGIGKVGMDFDSFVYYTVIPVEGGGYGLEEFPDGLDGFIIPEDTDIAFRVTLVNYDALGRAITLNSHSILWMIFPTIATQVRCSWWYIVNVNETGIIQDTFTDVSLPYAQATTVYFASDTDLGDEAFERSQSEYDGPAAVNLMLLGKIGTANYGQNIPFVSVYVP